MGGDDLDDTEDLHWIRPVRGESGKDDDSSSIDDRSPTNKRVRPEASNEANNKKVKREDSTQQVLWKAGRNLHQQSHVEQAQFLTTAIRHYALLQQSSVVATDEATEEGAAQISILPHHCLKNEDVSELEATDGASHWLHRIRQVVSLKTLRDWKPVGSPCVIVICASARRAVSLLKHELAPLKVRTAKLFPKNGSLDEQCQSLTAASIPIAVGTPHRLRQLSSYSTSPGGKSPCLQWDHTQLVILDAFPQKQYTVCTLPDTAAECMQLLREFVYPQLSRRRKHDSSAAKGPVSHQRACQISFLA